MRPPYMSNYYVVFNSSVMNKRKTNHAASQQTVIELPTNKRATLSGLPQELVEMVASCLDHESLLNCRLASKNFTDKTYTAFATAFFETRYFMLQERSLRNLLEVSEHPFYKDFVRSIVLCVDHVPEIDVDEADESPEYEDHTPWDNKPFLEYRRIQKIQAKTNIELVLLTRAMVGLTNCKKILIGDEDRPWGAVQLMRHLGVELDNCIDVTEPYAVQQARQLVKILLQAMIASRIPVEELAIRCGYLKDEDTSLSPVLFLTNEVNVLNLKVMVEKIRRLDLIISPDDVTSSKRLPPYPDCLLTFLGSFSNLTELKLSFYTRDLKGRFAAISFALSFPNLTSLLLESVDIPQNDLLEFLARHGEKLTKLVLDSINLTDCCGDWSFVVSKILEHTSVNDLTLVDLLRHSNDIIDPDEIRTCPKWLYLNGWQDLTDVVIHTEHAADMNPIVRFLDKHPPAQPTKHTCEQEPFE